ncbi:hypothetical protein TNCT_148981 [Trichonephila clavata]|uniref:Uncharacterized protein n=1 Tax=Trichonephila clavata TaxID=2740835 RepID=A0A8X6H600_TRICU|nr:hypothetical protein TNCT_148981 [Trichonephila clavata]
MEAIISPLPPRYANIGCQFSSELQSWTQSMKLYICLLFLLRTKKHPLSNFSIEAQCVKCLARSAPILWRTVLVSLVGRKEVVPVATELVLSDRRVPLLELSFVSVLARCPLDLFRALVL